MNSQQAVVPTQQKQVLFYGDTITAALAKIGQKQIIFVPINPLCTLLGLNWSGQHQRINRDSILSKKLTRVVIQPLDTSNEGGGEQEFMCLPLDYINGWLFGINANRVKPEVKERLLIYQENCYQVLAEAFQEGRLTSDPTFDDLLQSDSEAVQAYKMAMAVVKLARQQILLEARLDQHEEQMTDYGNRLEQIEAQLGNPDRYLAEEQASQISQAVAAIAMAFKQKTNRNEFGAIYGELYRKFGVTSYKHIPAARFDEAMHWLTDWYQSVTDEDVPF